MSELAHTIAEALAYRGYVTVSRHDGSRVIGFVYDGSHEHVEMYDESATGRLRIPITEIAKIELTGDDCAAKAQRIWERRAGALEPRLRPTMILVGLSLELRAVARAMRATLRDGTVRGRFGGSGAVALVTDGSGVARAIEAERPRLAICCGFSGALEAALAPGDLVLATSVRDESGDALAADPVALATARAVLSGSAREGEIRCVSRVAATRAEKQQLAETGGLVVDLESWPVARAAARAGIPWLAVRVVLDPLGEELPAFTREPRRGYIAPALRYAAGGPRNALALARLGLQARAATRTLEYALRRLSTAFAEPEELAS